MWRHSWGDGVPTPLSPSQPLCSYLKPQAGPSVPTEPLPRIGSVGVLLGTVSAGFNYFLYTSTFGIVLRLKREQPGPCHGL